MFSEFLLNMSSQQQNFFGGASLISVEDSFSLIYHLTKELNAVSL